MRFRDIFSMAGGMVLGGARRAYWLRNGDGTVSVMVKMKPADGSKEKAIGMVEDAREAVREIGERAVECHGKVLSCNSFLGFGKDKKLEAVGMATLQADETVEQRLDSMKLVYVD